MVLLRSNPKPYHLSFPLGVGEWVKKRLMVSPASVLEVASCSAVVM